MIFNSLHYLVFLPLVALFCFLLPVKWRWIWLLIASYYFYMVWEPVYILLIIIATLVDYFCAIKMDKLSTRKQRRPYMALSLITGLGILCTFKYFNFFTSSLNDLFVVLRMDYMIPYVPIILPLGISFYTFQTLSYTIDVYKGKAKAEKHLGLFALYVMYFPQLVAGPIERAKSLLSQFHFNYKFNWNNLVSGLRLVMLGLFKKIVIADQLGVMVGNVFNHPESAEGISIYLACILFIQQVYCDFSGYSDIARGSSRIFGIELMENFNLPFFSKSMSNFWARWHISLMNWFRDYIMFPLIKKQWSWPLVFMLVFFISGFWHGANWTFVAWGVYNGLVVIYAKSTIKYRSKLLDMLGLKGMKGLRHFVQAICVVHLFAFSSVFFRAATLHDSWTFIKKLCSDFTPSLLQIYHNVGNIRQEILYLGKDAVSFYLIIGFVVILELFQWQLRKRTLDEAINSLHPVFRLILYTGVVISISLMSNIAETPFIYFQF